MKKILIAGAGVEQVPAIEIAKSMGHFVIVTDISELAPGVKLADKFFRVSTNDKKGNLEISEKENIDGIMTLCSETAVPVIAYVSEKLGLPGMSQETALAATNKATMKEYMTKQNIELFGYSRINTFEELKYFTDKYHPPWVIKPSDSSGQRGVRLIKEEAELQEAYLEAKKFSTDNIVIMEEYLEGPEINVTCLLIEGKVHVLSLSDRMTLPPPHFGIAHTHLAPPDISSSDAEKIKDLAIRSSQAIGLKNGITYPQVIITKNGPRLLEIAARIPGGFMREVAMYVSGVDMIKTTIKQSLGESLVFNQQVTEPSYPALAVKFITTLDLNMGNKKITGISGLEEAAFMPGIVYSTLRLTKGMQVPPLTNSGGRFGAIIAVGDSRADVLEKAENAFKKIKVS